MQIVVLTNFLYWKQIEYTDKKGKKKSKRDESAAPVLYVKRIYLDETKKKKIVFISLKGE